jgi:hypothetical protein
VVTGWLLPPVLDAKAGAPDRAWTDLSLEVLLRVFRHAPDDMHASYRDLLRNEYASEYFRVRLARATANRERMRWLLQPVDRECDRNLVLLFPDHVAAAIAGTAEERRRIVDLLSFRVRPPASGGVGRQGQTVELWRAQIDAIGKLPAAERARVFEAIAANDSLMAIGIDVVPLLRAAQQERDAAVQPPR